MPISLRFKRDVDSVVDSATLQAGELQINTTTNAIHVHDGITAGGMETANPQEQTNPHDTILTVTDNRITDVYGIPVRTMCFNMTNWSLEEFQTYAMYGFKYVRLDMVLDKTNYTDELAIFDAAHACGLGVIPVLFAEETIPVLDDMIAYTENLVQAFAGHPGVAGWEIGKGWDQLQFDGWLTALQTIAQVIRNNDPIRLISSGNIGGPITNGTWSEFATSVFTANPDPINTISVQISPDQMFFMDPDYELLTEYLVQLRQIGKPVMVSSVGKDWSNNGGHNIWTQGFFFHDRIGEALYRSGVQLGFMDGWGSYIHPNNTDGSKTAVDGAVRINQRMMQEGFVAKEFVRPIPFTTINRPTTWTSGSFTFQGEIELQGTVGTTAKPKYEPALVTSADDLAVGGFSASFWIEGTANFDTGVDHVILSRGDNSTQGFDVRWSAATGCVVGTVYGPNGSYSVSSRPWSPSEGWTHFVVQMDNIQCRDMSRHGGQVYVNGALSGYTACPTGFEYGRVGDWIGAFPIGLNTGGFKFANFSIYKRTLHGGEVVDLYVRNREQPKTDLGIWVFASDNRTGTSSQNYKGSELTPVGTPAYGDDFILTRAIIGR